MKKMSLESEIINLVSNSEKPLKLNAILDKLKIARKYRASVKRILRDMVKNRYIDKYRNTYVAREFKRDNIITGKVELKNDFGFLLVEEGEDIFLGKSVIEKLLPGDEVEVWVKKTSRGGKEGILKRIVQRTRNPLLCRVVRYGNYFAVPINRKGPLIKIKEGEVVKEGDIILLKVNETEKKLVGSIVLKLYDTSDITQYIEFVLEKYEIFRVFPEEVIKETEKINIDIGKQDTRIDLRKETVITIDPVDAKDFDDAVSLKKQDGFYLLGVHIADVSNYVAAGTILDKEAYKRGCSTYLPTQVYPMLPERLSSNICSLVENEDRFTLSVFIKFDLSGAMVSYDIKETIIRNKKRLTYEEAEDIIKGKKMEKNLEIKNLLLLMDELKNKLKRRFVERGNIDFSIGEPAFVCDFDKKIIDIKRKTPLESHKIIEYFMISANICAADFILKNYKYGIYRIHPKPFNKDIEEFNFFLKSISSGLKLKKATNKEFQKILNATANSELSNLIKKNLLKAMPLAKYSEKNLGHFGLGLDKYAHFTSPIRRYADLVVHRIIKKIMGNDKTVSFQKEQLKTIAKHITEREEKTENAENEIFRIYALDFLRKKIGESFCATIIKIVKNGIIVELDEYPVEGFIGFDTMEEDYYIYNPLNMTAVGKRTKKIYKLGDKIFVIIIKIDMESQKLVMEIE